MKDWHAMDIEQVLREVKTDLHKGLTEDEAKKRLQKDGYNEVTLKRKIPAEKPVRKQVVFIETMKDFCKSYLERVKQYAG